MPRRDDGRFAAQDYVRIALGLALALSAMPASGQQDYWLPRLPVTVRMQPDPASPFCGSASLAAALKRRTFLWTLAAGEPSPGWDPDFFLDCSEPDHGKLLIRLIRRRDRAEAYRMRVTKVPPEDQEWLTGKLIAQTLAEKRKVIESALSEFKRGNQYGLSEKGAQALQDGKWTEAVEYLNLALESDPPGGAIHYGLALAHARLGARERAVWHYLAYLAIEGKELEDASHEPLEALLDLSEASSGLEATFATRLREAKDFAANDHWNDAIFALKKLAQEAPWSFEVCDTLAGIYEVVDWNELASVWRERGRLARRVAKNRDDHEAVARFLDDL